MMLYQKFFQNAVTKPEQDIQKQCDIQKIERFFCGIIRMPAEPSANRNEGNRYQRKGYSPSLAVRARQKTQRG